MEIRKFIAVKKSLTVDHDVVLWDVRSDVDVLIDLTFDWDDEPCSGREAINHDPVHLKH